MDTDVVADRVSIIMKPVVLHNPVVGVDHKMVAHAVNAGVVVDVVVLNDDLMAQRRGLLPTVDALTIVSCFVVRNKNVLGRVVPDSNTRADVIICKIPRNRNIVPVQDEAAIRGVVDLVVWMPATVA